MYAPSLVMQNLFLSLAYPNRNRNRNERRDPKLRLGDAHSTVNFQITHEEFYNKETFTQRIKFTSNLELLSPILAQHFSILLKIRNYLVETVKAPLNKKLDKRKKMYQKS